MILKPFSQDLELTGHPRLTQRLRTNGTIPLPFHTPSCRTQGKGKAECAEQTWHSVALISSNPMHEIPLNLKGLGGEKRVTNARTTGVLISLYPDQEGHKLMFLSEWREFPSAPCFAGEKNLIKARVSMLLKSRASLTCFRVCFLLGRTKDLSAPRYITTLRWTY